jgi:hypothetical protein
MVSEHGSPEREQIRAVMKELNLVSSARNLSLLPRAELGETIAAIASSAQGDNS